MNSFSHSESRSNPSSSTQPPVGSLPPAAPTEGAIARPSEPPAPRSPARDRILLAAGELFNREGVHAVGIDRVIDLAGVAKASLYKHFRSKDDLVAAWLERVASAYFVWFAGEVERLAPDPADRPAVVFRVLELWFQSAEFRGCPFINISGEVGDAVSRARKIAMKFKSDMRVYLEKLCREAGLSDPPARASTLALLMDGATVRAAMHGDPCAAREAGVAAATLLRGP